MKIIEEEIIKCKLFIAKPDFFEKEWEVFFAGQFINIRILDQKFMSEVKKGKIEIASCCRLFCDLQVKTKIDDQGKIVDTDYIAKNVVHKCSWDIF